MTRSGIYRLFAVFVAVFSLGAGVSGPVTALEIGTNDFRISAMGPDSPDPDVLNFGGFNASVVYNSQDDEFFVVWTGTDDVDGQGTSEIFGQRLDAQTGALLGDRVRLSDLGEDESDVTAGLNDPPAVAYNSQDNQYLVVWAGDDVDRDFGGSQPIADNEREVYGQRVDAAGQEIGDNDFRISVTGDDGDAAQSGIRPSVAYNSADNEYLVVWMAFDTAFQPNKAGDLFGLRIGGDGSIPAAPAILRVPDAANEFPGNFLEMDETDVAYNAIDNEYFVVFRCDCFGEAGVTEDGPGVEIFGQRVDASAAGIGVEKRLSDMGPGNTAPNLVASQPRIAFNASQGEYLAVWTGDDVNNNENEIFGQRLSAAGDELGTNDFRISFMGPDGDAFFTASNSNVVHNSRNGEYFVVWQGDDDEGGLIDDDFEIFSQRVEGAFDAPTGDLIGVNVRLSDMRGIGSVSFSAQSPAVAYNPVDNISLVVWDGDDDVPPLAEFEREVFGQLVTEPECGNGFVDSGETCDDGNADDTDACLSTCAEASCGDGFVREGVEACDSTDGCADDCTLIPAGTTGGTTTGSGTTGGGSTGGTTTAGDDSPGGGCSLLR